MTRHAMESKSFVIVNYRPHNDVHSSHHPFFHLIADATELPKWKKDHKSIPLSQVLETMQVFISKNGGSKTGIFQQPSKQELLENCHTDNVDEIFEIILESGHVENLHQSKHAEAYQTIFRGHQS